MSHSTLRIIVALCILCLMAALGCSRKPRNVVPVKGKVTLGGQPLAGATIVFTPAAENASSSRGRTNDSGEYVLLFSAGVEGAAIGEHAVFITTGASGAKGAEKVPFKYRTGPDQPKATVVAGPNTIDFSLDPGPVDPPQAKGKRK